jgi:hypothetical protein
MKIFALFLKLMNMSRTNHDAKQTAFIHNMTEIIKKNPNPSTGYSLGVTLHTQIWK